MDSIVEGKETVVYRKIKGVKLLIKNHTIIDFVNFYVFLLTKLTNCYILNHHEEG